MDPRPPPDRAGGRSRYGQHQQHQQAAAFRFLVDPTEGPAGASSSAAAAVRAFFPAHEGEPPSSSAAERYGAEISLGQHGMHRGYHQFGGAEGNQDGGTSSGGSLPRHSSSPPGFFSSPVVDTGFASGRVGVGGGSDVQHAPSSYNRNTKGPMNLPSHPDEKVAASNVSHSSSGFSIGSWEDSNCIAFSGPSSKAGIDNNDDIIATLSNYELQFGATREARGANRYMQMQHDQVPFRVRAKRGCATHPRSIAERERRTRISEKLRKLQALVPNMDKQTSTADMLDLAVDHIKGLQSELQALKEGKEKCICRGNHSLGN